MIYECSICKSQYEESYKATNCFFKHENYMDFFYTLEGTGIHELCEMSNVRNSVPTQFSHCISKASVLIDELAKYIRKSETTDTVDIRSAVADMLIHLTKVAYLCSTEEQMLAEIKRKTENLRRELFREG